MAEVAVGTGVNAIAGSWSGASASERASASVTLAPREAARGTAAAAVASSCLMGACGLPRQ